MKYEVTVIMQYTEKCYVEADSKAEAEQLALECEDREEILDAHPYEAYAIECEDQQ